MDEAELAAIGPLPYHDKEYDAPGVREAVDALINQECGRFAPTNYLEYLGPEVDMEFESPMLKIELKRIERGVKQKTFDVQRYEVKEPEGAERGDEGVWRARTAQAQAQLEHQEVRALNLELLQRYGKGAWLTHCDELERIRKALQQRLDAVEAEKQALNAARAAEQTDGGARIRDLETQLAMVIARDFELQMALRRLQAEVAIIRQQATDSGAL